jgi:hypothetical protein
VLDRYYGIEKTTPDRDCWRADQGFAACGPSHAGRIRGQTAAIAQWETDRTGQVRDNMERIAKVLNTSLG